MEEVKSQTIVFVKTKRQVDVLAYELHQNVKHIIACKLHGDIPQPERTEVSQAPAYIYI